MMQRWERLFRRDFWLKVLAVALAILLWTMVVADYNKETTVPFDVPLGVKQHPTLEMIDGRRDLETVVEVRVTGPSLLVSSLKAEDLKAWVDYGRVTVTGKSQDAEVMVEGPARIRDQVRYRAIPTSVPVTLVELKTIDIPVSAQPESGVVAVGSREFRYTAAVADKSVRLTGRADYLTYVRWGIVTLTDQDLLPPLDGQGALKEKTSIVRKPIEPVDSTGKKVEKLAQPYTDVTLSWQELPPGKQMQVVPKTRGSLPNGFELAGVRAEPGAVTVRSAAINGKLPEGVALETEPVDITGQTKTFTAAARLIPPPGTGAAVTSVNVTVSITEAKVEKVFGALPVGVAGQPGGTDVAKPLPTVQVRLTGPYLFMQPLDASAIEVYVDLTGLTEGRHRLPVKVRYPPGVLEVAVDPAVIEVVISNR